jgi:hypothetical protein
MFVYITMWSGCRRGRECIVKDELIPPGNLGASKGGCRFLGRVESIEVMKFGWCSFCLGLFGSGWVGGAGIRYSAWVVACAVLFGGRE